MKGIEKFLLPDDASLEDEIEVFRKIMLTVYYGRWRLM